MFSVLRFSELIFFLELLPNTLEVNDISINYERVSTSSCARFMAGQSIR